MSNAVLDRVLPREVSVLLAESFEQKAAASRKAISQVGLGEVLGTFPGFAVVLNSRNQVVKVFCAENGDVSPDRVEVLSEMLSSDSAPSALLSAASSVVDSLLSGNEQAAREGLSRVLPALGHGGPVETRASVLRESVSADRPWKKVYAEQVSTKVVEKWPARFRGVEAVPHVRGLIEESLTTMAARLGELADIARGGELTIAEFRQRVVSIDSRPVLQNISSFVEDLNADLDWTRAQLSSCTGGFLSVGTLIELHTAISGMLNLSEAASEFVATYVGRLRSAA